MWISPEDALRLVAAAADDYDTFTARAEGARRLRDALLQHLHGQSDMKTGDLAKAARLTPARVAQIARDPEAPVWLPERIRQTETLAQTLEGVERSARITSLRRVSLP
jgi:hypothetical protein